jgi:hypothetical protein
MHEYAIAMHNARAKALARAMLRSRYMSGVANTTDATRGQPLAARVLARKDELEEALADLGPHDPIERQAIETALATVYSLMTGDLAHPSAVVAHDLNCWLERHKHLGQQATWRRRTRRRSGT